MKRRVVVTGMGGVSPIGSDWSTVRDALRLGRSGVRLIKEWGEIQGLETQLAAPVHDFEVPEAWPRKATRTMGKDSLMATRAAELALADAGLLGADLLCDGSAGIAFGSTQGSPEGMAVYAHKLFAGRTTRGIRGSDFIRFMSHTCAANLAQFFGITGRIVPTCSACTSGSQGIGYAYESVAFGCQDVMLGGGAEEIGAIDATVFDILAAASTRNDAPQRTPRPFDRERDGTVVAEGAGVLILEELEHARRRCAPIHAEVLGWATNCDGRHMTNPDRAGMERVMRQALADAQLAPTDVDYINAHGTATEVGDVAESEATLAVFGNRIPVSTLKGHMGHTLGACGALEAWMTLRMISEGWVAPTLNLEEIDGRCAPLDYVMGTPRELSAEIVVSNNFAFGGVNTSLVFRRWQ
jgi:3-oxoacyl-[acyl-carrier-protein] synthase II